jgi:hypothetical protein
MPNFNRREIRRRRRKYIREEKASIRREKRAIRRKRNEFRKRQLIGWASSLVQGLRKMFIHGGAGSGIAQKKAESRRRRREYAHEERRSIRREKREMRRKYRPMRRKIRQERMIGAAKSLVNFFTKHPVKRRKSEDRKLAREIIKREDRRRLRQRIISFPVRLMASVTLFWRNRWSGMKKAGANTADLFATFREVTGDRELRRQHLITLLNSTTFFVLSFLTVFFLNQIVTIITASFFDIPAVLFSYRIYWPLYTYSSLYTRAALIVIFGIGPLLCLVLGFVFYRLFLRSQYRQVYYRQFLLWAALHGFNNFFGAYIVGVITRTGFIYTSEWLFLSNVLDVEEIVFLSVSIIVMIVAGYLSTKQFLNSAISQKIIAPRIRVVYVFSMVMLPWVTGNILLYLMNVPRNPFYLLLLYFTTLLAVIPVFTNFNTTTNQQLKLEGTIARPRISWLFLILMVTAIIGIRYGLMNGISFG